MTSNPDEGENKNQHGVASATPSFGVSGALILVGIVLILLQAANLGFLNLDRTLRYHLPISIRADSQADYSADSPGFVVPSISESILWDIIMSMQGEGDPDDRMATLEAILDKPVPSRTQENSQSMSATATPVISQPAPQETATTTTTTTSILPGSASTATPAFQPTATPILALPTLPPILPTSPAIIPSNVPLPTVPPILPTLPPIPTLPTLFP